MVKDGQRTSMTIPQGGEVEGLGWLDGDRLLDVLWKRKTVMMFTTNIFKSK
jgi:hypothetical protein